MYPTELSIYSDNNFLTMVDAVLVGMVEKAAMVREDPRVPRDYIIQALEDIDAGRVEVERYPLGKPTLRGVYDIASRMYFSSVSESSSQ